MAHADVITAIKVPLRRGHLLADIDHICDLLDLWTFVGGDEVLEQQGNEANTQAWRKWRHEKGAPSGISNSARVIPEIRIRE